MAAKSKGYETPSEEASYSESESHSSSDSESSSASDSDSNNSDAPLTRKYSVGYLAQDSDDESGNNKQSSASPYDKTETKSTGPKATATEYPSNTAVKTIAPAARKLNRTSRNHKIVVDDNKTDTTDSNNTEEPVTPKSRSLHLKSRDKPILVEPIKPQFSSTSTATTDEFSPIKAAREGRDWNSEFQKLVSELRRNNALHNPDDRSAMQVYHQLTELGNDFLYAAKTYGKIIISEYCLNNKYKTIKPATNKLGGIAGGEKFICNGIVFKFAVDKIGLYGGDGNAMKAAGHDLRNTIQLLECQIPDLCFPLMCTIDWCGYRLIAMCLLPIDKSTIIYGSCDAGETVHDKDLYFSSLMKEAAKKLNLAEHIAGVEEPSSRAIWACADAEGHRGQDSRYYVIDLARLCPPEATARKTYLYKQLRPEYVQKYKVPLNPDVFSRFIDHDPHRKHAEADVRLATSELRTTVIPKFAMELAQRYSDTNPEVTTLLSSERLVMELHGEGINLRLLGLVRQALETQSTCQHVRRLLLLEMICRVMKEQINSKMRDKMTSITTASSLPFDKVAMEYYNFFLANQEFWTAVLDDEAKSIKRAIMNKFEAGLTAQELDSNYRLTPEPMELFTRLQELSGIKLYKSAKEDAKFNFTEGASQLSVTDIEERAIKVKHMNIIGYSHGISLLLQARDCKHREQKLRILAKANVQFEKSQLYSLFRPKKGNREAKELMTLWGDVLYETGMLVDEASKSRRCFELAAEKYFKAKSVERLLMLGNEGSKKLLDAECKQRKNAFKEVFETVTFLKYLLGPDLSLFMLHNASPNPSLNSSADKNATTVAGNSSNPASPTPSLNSSIAENEVPLGLRRADSAVKLRTSLALSMRARASSRGTLTSSPMRAHPMLGASQRVGLVNSPAATTARPRWSYVQEWGTVLFTAAHRLSAELGNSSEAQALFAVAGRYFKEALKCAPEDAPLAPLVPWIFDVKRDDEVAMLVQIIQHSADLTKFDSSWCPQLTADSLRCLLSHAKVKELVLTGFEVLPEVFSELGTLAAHLTDLEVLVVKQSSTVTFEALKQIVEHGKLRALTIYRCPLINSQHIGVFKQRGVQHIEFEEAPSTLVRLPSGTKRNITMAFRENSSGSSTNLSPVADLTSDDQENISTVVVSLSSKVGTFYSAANCNCVQLVVNSMAFQWQDEAGKNVSLSPRDYYAQYTAWSSALIAQLKQSPGNATGFRAVMQQVYRRLFRLCGHLCFAHLSELDYNDFLSSFAKLITCGEHYKLVSQVDFSRLEGIVSYVKKHAQQ